MELPSELRETLDGLSTLDAEGAARVEAALVRVLRVAAALSWARERVPALLAARKNR